MGAQLDADLRTLLQYYGEDPASTKPEDLFGIVVSFSQSLVVRVPAVVGRYELISRGLQRAESEVKAADKKAGPASSAKRPPPEVRLPSPTPSASLTDLFRSLLERTRATGGSQSAEEGSTTRFEICAAGSGLAGSEVKLSGRFRGFSWMEEDRLGSGSVLVPPLIACCTFSSYT